MGVRFIFIASIFALLYAGLGYKLYDLQILQGKRFSVRAEGLLEGMQQGDLRRGQIFVTDRGGTNIPIALNRDYPVVFASPKEMGTSTKQIAEQVATMTNLNAADLLKIFRSNPNSLYVRLLDKPTDVQVSALRDADLPGIHFKTEQYRAYPYSSLAAHVVGFAGLDATHGEPVGLYGIEKLQNASLVGGDDVSLTIDRNLQAHAEQVLDKLMGDHEAMGGSILITEPKTGKILVMASTPGFDPNTYSKFPVKNYRNPAVEDQYEPGSVFKPLTMAAGIDTGAFTPETTFVDTGKVTLNGKTVTNWDHKAYGKITMTNVIEHSVNTGAIFAEGKVGNQTFTEYLKRFGFGQLTGVDLPGETAGSIRNLDRKGARQIDFATASYGQGTAVTPVQMAAAFGALANGGLLMRPYILQEDKPEVVRRVVSEDTAQKVTAMMESAVNVNVMAAIPNYRIAGKTGTAFVPKPGGYYDDQFIHTFIGYGPVSDPKFLILMKLDRPQIGQLAGATIVPLFRDVAEFVLNYYSIAPDKLATSTNGTAQGGQ